MNDPRPPFEHRYFATYPVENERTAAWFSKKITYSVIDLLWKAGPRGLTPKEVYDGLAKEKRQSVSQSLVYQTLRGLYENDKVRREWDNEAQAQRNILTEKSLPAFLDEDFQEWADNNLKSKIESSLFPAFLTFLSQIMKASQEKKISTNFLPNQGKAGWCHNCDMSHEAEFFFLGLLYHAACSFVYSPGEWKFANKTLENEIEKLYTDNKLADPKGISPSESR